MLLLVFNPWIRIFQFMETLDMHTRIRRSWIFWGARRKIEGRIWRCKIIWRQEYGHFYIIVIKEKIPFKKECERGQGNSCKGLSVENKDKRIGSLRDGHFWEQCHSCVNNLYQYHCHVGFVPYHHGCMCVFFSGLMWWSSLCFSLAIYALCFGGHFKDFLLFFLFCGSL